MWEDSHKDYKLTDVLEIRFIELPKFRKKQPDMSKPLDRWLLFLEDSPKEVLEMAMKAEPAIEKAQKVLEYLGTNEEIRRYYELREKAIHDEITRITGAKEEGIQQGIQQQRLEVARKMIKDGFDDTMIEKYTGISKDEIMNLKREQFS
ncbi:Rpn family recombination-promoting nuclease/putative transposase [Acetivibrio cellulolyticus]|uniref:Rpn family recombination-promoting nuclease/putative transposase n=1 Tax=Acetivibrio cellulolyticus TaxID=35830 RepID=UPI0002481B81|nr:Rpn family recombination-promoting nuclease/putative transposase [Acetivibrio cellulolyticus]